MPVPPPPLQQLQRSWHRSQLDKGTLYSLLSVPALHSAAMHSTLQPFHIPIFLSVHIPLGGPFKPVRLGGACNAAGSFILTTLTRPHAHRHRRQPHFCGSFVLTRTFRASSVRSTAHPHHGHFIDPRRIICTPHRWGRFPRLDLLGQTSADFRALSDTVRLCACTMPGAVLGQAFQGVTPSFHLSEYQFYETDLFSKLLSIFLFFSQLHA